VPDSYWQYLRELHFTGDLDAMPEGTVAFAEEPLLQVRAPIIEAQLAETFVLATMNHQTLIATKAARLVDAAAGRPVIEFGARRAHGFDAAVFGARAAFIGCAGTSNTLAGQAFDIPVHGTAAHSFIMAFAHEAGAFAAFQRTFPEDAIVLIDTYDTLEGARRAARLGAGLGGVRLDSGDLVMLSREVRRILDEADRREVRIVASGDLDEARIAALTAAGAPIDVYGVGTELITSRDAPALSGVYKLVAVEEVGGARAVLKRSPEKASLPGAKQVWRRRGADGRFAEDVLALRDERPQGEPQLTPLVRGGRRVAPTPTLADARARARTELDALPPGIRRLTHPDRYPVTPTPALRTLAESLHPER